MEETPVVACFLRNGGEVLLLRRSEVADVRPGQWDAVASRVAPDTDDAPRDDRGREFETVALRAIDAETGLADAVEFVRAGDPFHVADRERGVRRLVRPFLFDSDSRTTETGPEVVEVAWVPPPEIRRRDAVPGLWAAYDRVRPRVATVREDRTRGSATLSVRALEVLRDEAAIARDAGAGAGGCAGAGAGAEAGAGAADSVPDAGDAGAEPTEASAESNDGDAPPERREAAGDDWAALADLARDLLDARPSMAVVANRVHRAMHEADGERTATAVERAATDGVERALRADAAAAEAAAGRLPDRVATLSRSGTVLAAIRAAEPRAVLVAESRPGREGVDVAEAIAGGGASETAGRDGDGEQPDVTLATDAAFAERLVRWDAEALVVGADRILPDGRVVNKVGTRGAALAAPAACPCYVVAAADKVATDDAVHREERPGAEVYDGPAPVSVANPTFDVTPAAAVDAVITDEGSFEPGEVEELAAERRRWSEWDADG